MLIEFTEQASAGIALEFGIVHSLALFFYLNLTVCSCAVLPQVAPEQTRGGQKGSLRQQPAEEHRI